MDKKSVLDKARKGFSVTSPLLPPLYGTVHALEGELAQSRRRLTGLGMLIEAWMMYEHDVQVERTNRDVALDALSAMALSLGDKLGTLEEAAGHVTYEYLRTAPARIARSAPRRRRSPRRAAA